mgnify:CR=1 FL=1
MVHTFITKTNTCSTVGEVSWDLLIRKGRRIEGIRQTSAALLQHVKQAAYQVWHICGQFLVAAPALPDTSELGWQYGADQTWQPVWTLLPKASETYLKFSKCGCNVSKGKRGRYNCVPVSVFSTVLYNCRGRCYIIVCNCLAAIYVECGEII